METIVLGTDHAGFDLKEAVKEHLTSKGYAVEDCGAHENDPLDDYPDFIIPAAKKVVELNCQGIIFGGSGQGEAIAANRVKGARAALYYGGNEDIVTLSREHNNANILSLGARMMSVDDALSVIDKWLSIPHTTEERHLRRINKLDA